MNAVCLACGGKSVEPIADLGDNPVLVGAVSDAMDEARRMPLGRLELGLCDDCGHVQNVAFDVALIDYDQSYDNSLHYSPTFQRFADELADRLVSTYHLTGRRVVELGSGSGDFLRAVCQRGDNTGVGFDPTYDGPSESPRVTLIPDYFRPGDHLDNYDLLVCRHVLEHLDNPVELLTSLAASAAVEAVHYFEVPAAEFNFGPEGLWDCIYPHVSYFSADALRALVERSGFEILAEGFALAGQFRYVEAKARPEGPSGAGRDDVAVREHLARVRSFARRYGDTVDSWRQMLEDSRSRGEEVALWGAGSKGVNFLNAVDQHRRLRVIDLNPRKWGKHIAGSGHRIDAPESLADTSVTKVIVPNPLYRQEIEEMVRSLHVDADVLTI